MENKKIALTFDDGPSQNTLEILKLLKKNNAYATFFIIGKRIKGNENIIKEIIKQKHEIGNHSFSHLPVILRSKKSILEDFKKTDEELAKLNIKTNLVRFPYINLYLFGKKALVCMSEMKKRIGYADVDSLDWLRLPPKTIIKIILNKVKNNSVIMLHDSFNLEKKNKDIVYILKELLPELSKKGYKFVTLNKIKNLF